MAYGADDRIDTPPVTDWVNDWDWLDDGWGENAISIWNDVREQCPIGSTERYGRAFMPGTMDAVRDIANNKQFAWGSRRNQSGINPRVTAGND